MQDHKISQTYERQTCSILSMSLRDKLQGIDEERFKQVFGETLVEELSDSDGARSLEETLGSEYRPLNAIITASGDYLNRVAKVSERDVKVFTGGIYMGFVILKNYADSEEGADLGEDLRNIDYALFGEAFTGALARQLHEPQEAASTEKVLENDYNALYLTALATEQYVYEVGRLTAADARLMANGMVLSYVALKDYAELELIEDIDLSAPDI